VVILKPDVRKFVKLLHRNCEFPYSEWCSITKLPNSVITKSSDHPISITLIGAGNLSYALGPALQAAGYRIDAVAGRNLPASRRRALALAKKLKTKAVVLDDLEIVSEIIWLCQTDDALAETARRLSRRDGWKGKIVFHSSGALTSEVLSPLRDAGAATASLHPMMTFVPGSEPSLEGVAFAVEGDRRAVTVARQAGKALKADIFEIKKSAKVLYHALGSFSSPMLVATLATAERVGRVAGFSQKQLQKIMAPILRQTLQNYLSAGAAAAFSGPVKRGDVNTIRGHLKELAKVPAANAVYRALVQSALKDLPSRNKAALAKLLK
jgi:predicted short-subunit dehydrogenase-like oxidoreductase (DUF2520 family)